MKERHILLYNSIGILKEEHDAMKTVTILIVGFTSYVLIGTLFEAIFFSLYNSSYHPFANILDLSDEVFVRQRLISDQQITSDLPVAIQLSEVSSSTTDNIESCQKRTDANVSKGKHAIFGGAFSTQIGTHLVKFWFRWIGKNSHESTKI